MSRIVVFGAGGRSGRALIAEARSRGHRITAAVRDPAKYIDLAGEEVDLVAADAMKPDDVRDAAWGHDVAVNATRSAGDIEPRHLIKLNNALLSGLGEAGVRRLLIVGGAGALKVAPGLQFVDTPAFPDSAKPRGVAHREALKALRTSETEIEWVYVTPPPRFIADGPRTGTYRVGDDQLGIDVSDDGRIGTISYADYAIGIVDEIESPKHHNESFVLAY